MSISSANPTLRKSIMSFWWTGGYLHPGSHSTSWSGSGMAGNPLGPLPGLRYDYGWTERRIVEQLNLTPATIHRYLLHNSHGGMLHNSSKITHLEGDCLVVNQAAERRAGEMLSEMEKNPGAATSLHDERTLLPKLSELGISWSQSHRWQLEASVPEEIYRAMAKANQKAGGGRGPSGRQISDDPIDTKRELAKIANVSHDTVMKVCT